MIGKVTFIFLAIVAAKTQCFAVHSLNTRMSNNGLGGTKLEIYDGTPTTIEKHPYLVSILLNWNFYCAATIVSQGWVVTTAECVYAVQPSRMAVIAGSDTGTYGTVYAVREIFLHPQFGSSTFDYDFACINLYGNFQWSNTVQTAMLPNANPAINSNMTVAGWGARNSLNKDGSNGVLMEGRMKWLALDACSNYYSGFGITWTDRLACAYNKGYTTLCSGDWGDGLIKDGVLYGMFIAAASKGFCSSNASPSILANVNSVAPWIRAMTGARMKDE